MNPPSTNKGSRYRTIVADPPWDMSRGRRVPGGARTGWEGAKGRPCDLPYETMTLEAIRSLGVGDLAARDAHLYLWVPNLHIEAGYDVARAWGFTPSTLLVWAKMPRGLGLGGAFTITTEFVIFARRGTLPASSRVDSTWWQWPRGEHSAKPEAFLDLVEAVSPGPYLEMFARRARFGWHYWGNESLGTAEVAA